MNGWAQLCSTCVLSPTLGVPPANSYRNLGSLKGCRMTWELEKEYSTRLRRMDCLKKLPMFVGFPFLTVSFSFSDRGQEIQRFWISFWNDWHLEVLEQCICSGWIHKHMSCRPGDWTRIFRCCQKNEVNLGCFLSHFSAMWARLWKRVSPLCFPPSNHSLQNNAHTLAMGIP